MSVGDRLVSVEVAVLRTRLHRCRVLMIVMSIMAVPVEMADQGVAVGVLVPFRQVQPDASGHQRGGDDQRPADLIAGSDPDDGAKERRNGIVGACPGGSHVPNADDEQHQAHAVGEEADYHRAADAQRGRKGGSHYESQGQVDRAGDEAFDRGQPGGVNQGNFTGQVVVDRPR